MALPTPTKTWQYNANYNFITYGDVLTEVKRVWWTIKYLLTSFATNPWKVVASSNGTTCKRYGVDAGVPGPDFDLWGASFSSSGWNRCTQTGYSSYDNWATNGNYRRSWIILRNSSLDTTFDICLDLWANGDNSSNSNYWRYGKVYCCHSYNLTGTGSVSARPSPNSGYAEYELRNGNYDSYGTVVPGNPGWQVYSWRFNAMQSTDGLSTRLFIFADRNLVGFWIFDRIYGAPDSYTNPVLSCVRGHYDLYDSVATYGWLHDNNNHLVATWTVGAASYYSYGYLSGEGLGSSTLGEANSPPTPNEMTNKYPMTPIGFVGASVGKRGRIGYLQDVWWGQSLVNGTTFPADGSRQFASFGSLIVPWNGDMIYCS